MNNIKKFTSVFLVIAALLTTVFYGTVGAYAAESEDASVNRVTSITYEPSPDTHKTFVITVKGRPTMVQLINPGGSTSTADRVKADIVSYNSEGEEVCSTSRTLDYEVWTLKTNMAAQGTLRARAKFVSPSEAKVYWEHKKDDADIMTCYVDTLGLNTVVYNVDAPEDAVPNSYVNINVETDEYCTGIQLVFPSGSTATYSDSKYITRTEDNHKIFACRAKVSSEGSNLITIKTLNSLGQKSTYGTVSIKGVPLKNKNIVLFGDSIFEQADAYKYDINIPGVIRSLTGANVYDFAISRSTAISGSISGKNVIDSICGLNNKNYDTLKSAFNQLYVLNGYNYSRWNYRDYEMLRLPTDVSTADGNEEIMSLLAECANVTDGLKNIANTYTMYFCDTDTAVAPDKYYIVNNIAGDTYSWILCTKTNTVASSGRAEYKYAGTDNTDLNQIITAINNNVPVYVMAEGSDFIMENYDFSKTDCFIFNWGTNDWVNYRSNMENLKEKWSGAIEYIVNQLKILAPDAKIVLCGVAPRFDKHNVVPDGFEEFYKYGKETASSLGIEYIDLFDGSPIIGTDNKQVLSPKYLKDSLHPNDKGCELFGGIISDKLLELFK